MKWVVVAASLLAWTSPARARLPDPVSMTTDPADRAVLPDVLSAIGSRSPDIARLDAVIAKLPRPTPLRGVVQVTRATILARSRDMAPAVAAIEEALRLLPDDPRAKLVATPIFTFSGAPQRAADLWMQASRESPEFARMSDRYLMMALIGRLGDVGDPARADRLSARLAEIGFSAGLAPERSDSAVARTREAMRVGRTDEALLGISMIGNPGDLLRLYVDRRFIALWPRIAEWAGTDLAAQSRRYLEELRTDWTAADSFETAVPYARQLMKMEAYATVIGLFLPMFDRVQPQPGMKEQSEAGQDGVELLAPLVARALDRTGRKAEARVLLAKSAAAMPADDQGHVLNIEGSYVTLAATDADWAEVVRTGDRFLARAAEFGDSVNKSASIQVQSWRACALSRLGRDTEARRAEAEVAMFETNAPGVAMQMHLCRGDEAAARALMLRALADEGMRGWALDFVQPVTARTLTPIRRIIEPVAQAVRTAPEVLAIANRVGRILPRPVDATLPDGFQPFRAPATPRPIGPDVI